MATSQYQMIPDSPLTNTEIVAVNWLVRVVNRFNHRFNTISLQRKGRRFEITWSLPIAIFFHGFFGAYIFIEAFNARFEPPDDSSLSWTQVIIVICSAIIFGIIPIFDIGTLLTAIASLSGQVHKEWMVGLIVDGFFELIGIVQSSNDHTKLAADLYECGFIVIGVIISQIHLHYVCDDTGITNGVILSVTKVLLGFLLASYDTTTKMEWTFGLTLLATSFLLKFSEGQANTQTIETAAEGEGTDDHTIEAAAEGEGTDAQTIEGEKSIEAAAGGEAGTDAKTIEGERAGTDGGGSSTGDQTIDITVEEANEEELNRKEKKDKQVAVSTTKPKLKSGGNRGLTGVKIGG